MTTAARASDAIPALVWTNMQALHVPRCRYSKLPILFYPTDAFGTEHPTAYLAGIVAIAFVRDLVAFGMFVFAQAVAQEFRQRGDHGIGVLRWVDFDDRVSLRAEFGMRQAHDDARHDVRVLGKRRLDFCGIDVRAAAENHVGAAVAEVEVSIRIDPPDVAQRFPSAFDALWLRADVVVGRAGAALWQEEDFA